MTWGWVINDIIFIFGWTNPLNISETLLYWNILLGIVCNVYNDFLSEYQSYTIKWNLWCVPNVLGRVWVINKVAFFTVF